MSLRELERKFRSGDPFITRAPSPVLDGRGGTIEVRSEVGRGSEFTVRIPLEEKAEETRREEGSS